MPANLKRANKLAHCAQRAAQRGNGRLARDLSRRADRRAATANREGDA